MKKRIVSSIMCLAMLLSLLPISAFAATVTVAGVTVDGKASMAVSGKTNEWEYKAAANSIPNAAYGGGIYANYLAAKFTAIKGETGSYYILCKDGKDLAEGQAQTLITAAGNKNVHTDDANHEVVKAEYFEGEDGATLWLNANKLDQTTKKYVVYQAIPQAAAGKEVTEYTLYKHTLDFTACTLPVCDAFTKSTDTNVWGKDLSTLVGSDFKVAFASYDGTAYNEELSADSNRGMTIKLSGTVNYVDGWTGFSSNESEQSGHYVAINVKNPNHDEQIKEIVLKGAKERTFEYADLFGENNDEDATIIVRVDDLMGEKGSKNFTLTYKGNYPQAEESGTNYAIATFTFDCSGLALAPAPATGLTVAADTTTGTDLFGKAAGDLQQNIKATVAAANDKMITVTGDSKYVTEWTAAYSGAQANGHFVALKLTQTPSTATVTVPSPTTTPNTKTLDPDGIWIVRLENFTDLSKVNVVVTPKGGTDADKVTYTLDLSDIAKEALGSVTVTEGTGQDAVQSSISATVDNVTKTIKLAGVMLTPGDGGTKLNLAYTSTLGNTTAVGTPAEVTIAKDGTCATQKITYMGAEYAINASGIELSPVEIAVNNPEPTVSEKIDAKDKSAVEGALDTIETAGTGALTSDATAKTAILAAANAVTDKQKEDYTDIKVEVGLKVEATGYTAPKDASGSTAAVPGVLKLEITPVYTVTGMPKGGGSRTDIVPAKELNTSTLAEPVTISITLPTNFVKSLSEQVVTKHYNADGVTVKEWLETRITSGDGGTFIASFDAASFSEYEIVADARKAVVTFDAGAGTCATASATYTPADIDKTSFPTATPTDTTKEFKGWTATSGGTTAEFSGKLTDQNLTALNGSSTLYAVYGTKSTGGSTGGGVSSNVTIDRPTNGKVSITPTAPSKGATVTINLTPDTGYAVGTVTVTDKDGKAVELTKVSDTQYTFTMPDGKVTVKASFTKVDTPPATGFTDVAADAYYADAVKWAVDNGITNGLTATTFGPNNSCTRGQMVTFLWRAAGSPAATGTNSFSDVASGEYYYNAVLWAVEKGITNGTSATTFSPNATVNRAQTVTFLYRYAESPAATGDTNFTDVASNAYYADAVKWAVAEEITNGTSATTFAPASNCTRGQIVTFLYRQIAE